MLKEKIQNELKNAMKEKAKLKLSVLRMLFSAIQNKEIEKRTKLSRTEKLENLEKLSQLNDEEVLSVIMSEAKKRKDSIEEYRKGNREDLVDKETKEMEILKVYLPEEMAEDEIKKIVQGAIKKTGAANLKDIGRVMAQAVKEIKGRAGNDVVSRVVKEELGKQQTV